MSPRIPTVQIREPHTPEELKAIAKRGPDFWERESYQGVARLISVDKDGIPWPAEFVFVPHARVVRVEQEEVGYGSNSIAVPRKAKASKHAG